MTAVAVACAAAVVLVALLVRDVAVRALAEQMAYRRERDASNVAERIDALEGRLASAEAAIRDATIARLGR